MARACPNCNNQVEAGANFCPACGQDMNVVAPQDQRIPTEEADVPPPPQGQRTNWGNGQPSCKCRWSKRGFKGGTNKIWSASYRCIGGWALDYHNRAASTL